MEGHALKMMIGAAALALALSSAASAATFSGSFSVYGDALHDPGLVVSTSPSNGWFSVDLADGESKSQNLFRIWTDEVAVNDEDDRTPRSLGVGFDVASHWASGAVEGSSVGSNGGFLNLFEGGSVAWEPLLLDVGTGKLSIALSNTDFNWGLIDIKEGVKYGADVYATFSYTASPAPVPVPAGLALILSGAGALGFFGWRRKDAAA
jgi:hypothetical protein